MSLVDINMLQRMGPTMDHLQPNAAESFMLSRSSSGRQLSEGVSGREIPQPVVYTGRMADLMGVAVQASNAEREKLGMREDGFEPEMALERAADAVKAIIASLLNNRRYAAQVRTPSPPRMALVRQLFEAASWHTEELGYSNALFVRLEQTRIGNPDGPPGGIITIGHDWGVVGVHKPA